MALNYSIAMLGNPQNKNEEKKAYARAQINGKMSLKELSNEVASKCTVHRADVSAVLISTVESLLAALKAGKQVDFGELAQAARDVKAFASFIDPDDDDFYTPGDMPLLS